MNEHPLDLVYLSVDKSGIYEMIQLVTNLTGKTYDEQLTLLTSKDVKCQKRYPTHFRKQASVFWTDGMITTLLLQPYHRWKIKAMESAIQQRAKIIVTPEIAQILLWFPMFRSETVVPIHIIAGKTQLNRFGRIWHNLAKLDREGQLIFLTNLSAKFDKKLFKDCLGPVMKFWTEERLSLLLLRKWDLVWTPLAKKHAFENDGKEDCFTIPMIPELAEIFLWFPFFTKKKGYNLFNPSLSGRLSGRFFLISKISPFSLKNTQAFI